MEALDVVSADTKAAAPFHPRRLGHANVYVSNYERAFEFYNQVVGFEEVYRQPNNRASFVSNGNTYHDFGLMDVTTPYAKPGQKPGLNHFALELRNEAEMVEGYRKALAGGLKFKTTTDHDVARSLYQLDPDGNTVELYADVVADWRTARHGIINKDKPQYVPGVTNQPLADELYPKNPEIRVVREALFKSKKVSHVALVANDYGAMYDFYTDYVGLVPLAGGRRDDFTVLRGSVATADVTLYRGREGVSPGLHHVGMEVWNEANLDAAVKELPARGITLVADVSHPARRAVSILDPDGIGLQFFVNRDWRPEVLKGFDYRTALHLL